jgi:hypothetical protein
MSGKFLIDLTDERFKIPYNDGVMTFVRNTNPSAHSDVGSVLLELGKTIPGAVAYCPSYGSLAYVVLHTASDHIFAIAFGQRRLAFRLAPSVLTDAVADCGTLAPDIGPDWVSFDPWDPKAKAGDKDRLRRWCTQAFANAGNPSY